MSRVLGLALLLAAVLSLPRGAAAVCGDSIIEPGEECEVGPNGDAACQEACVPSSLPDGCQCAYPVDDPRSYVALAGLRLRIGNEAAVTRGNVGVPVVGGYVFIGQYGAFSFTGQVVGDRVKMREYTAAGRLFANIPVLLPEVLLANGGPFAFDVPLAVSLPPLATGGHNDTLVSVAPAASAVLAPGTYGDVIVGRDATLTLQGLSPGSGAGRYDVHSLTVAFNGRLLADNPVDVRVRDRLRVLPTAAVRPSPTATALAGDVRIAVAGTVAKVAHNASLRAHVRGVRKVGIGAHADVTGQLSAPNVRVSADVQLTLEGGCGDGLLDAGEPCDASAPGGDAACPGACVAFDLPGQCTCP